MKSTLLTCFFAVFWIAGWGQSLSPASPEQLVNTDIPPNQNAPKIASAPDGSYVVIWITAGTNGELKARRYNSSHVPVTGELTIVASASEHLNIEYWKNGKYVISYVDGAALKFHVLDELNVVAPAIMVSTTVSFTKQDFAIKGDSLAFLYSRGSDKQLFLRGYNLSTNAWINSEIRVTERSGLNDSYLESPNIVYHNDGRITAIYNLAIKIGCCETDRRIMRKTYSSSFVAEMSESAMWAPGVDNYIAPLSMDVNGNNNGEILVTASHSAFPSTRIMRLWILSSTGTFIVNNSVLFSGNQYSWADGVAGHLYDNGDYVIAKSFWINLPNGNAPSPNYEEVYAIYGKNYDQSRTTALQVNTTSPGQQNQPVAAKLPNGGFVVGWAGPGFQGDSKGINIRAYNAVTFPGVVFSNNGAYTVSEAGTTATIGIALGTQPSGNVTVNLSSSDLTEGTVSPAQLTFTPANWNQVQNVTVTGVDDTDDDGDITFNLVASTTGSADAEYAALPNKTQAIVNRDNDATMILPSAQTICKSTGMSNVNALISNVGAAITSVTAVSNNQSVIDNSDITITNAGGGTYGITITNLSNNSLGTAQVTLTAIDGQFNYTGSFNVTTTGVTIVTSATSNSICQGESVTLSATGGQNISWNNGVVNDVAFIPSATTTYTVTADNGAGCTGTATETITVNPIPATPTVNANGPLVMCGSGSVTLTSSSASGNTWSTGETTQSITVSSTGNYTVTVSNGTCSATSAPTAVTVNSVPATPVITPNGVTTFCTGGSVTLTSSSATGNTWSTGETTQSIVVSDAGNYTVSVSNGMCSSTSVPTAVTVNTIPAAPVITPNGATAFCAGSSVTLTSSQATGNTWSTGETTQSIVVSNAGSYTVAFSNGTCSATSAPVAITVNSAPAAPVITPNGATTFCEGESVTLTSSSATGNSWSTGVTSQSINVTTTNTYLLTYTDANGCVSPAASILVTVKALPNVSAGADQTVCKGTSITLLGSGAASYSWTGGITNGTPFPINSQATFEVTGTGSNGCTNTDQVTVFVNNLPNVSAGQNKIVCNGASVTLNGSGAVTYTWDNGVTNGTSFVPVLGTTTYTVTGTDANGCEAEDDMTVTVNALPNVTLSTLPTFCVSHGSAVLNQGLPAGGTYSGNGISGSVFNPSTAGVGVHPVTYTYTDQNNCQNTASSTITVDQCLGVEELTANQWTVYPNPTTGLTQIEFSGSFNYFVTDGQGRTVLNGMAADMTKLDLSAFSDGVYQLTIQAESTSHTVRIVKN